MRRPGMLNAALLAAGVAQVPREPLELEAAWPHRERGFVARFGAGGDWWGVVHFGQERPSGAVAEGCERGEVCSLGQLAAFAWRFPADPLLAIDKALQTAAGPDAADQLRPLGYKPLYRCVLRHEHAQFPTRIAKLYPPELDEEALRVHQGLQELGGPRTSQVSVPPPASRVRAWRALVWPQFRESSFHELQRSADCEAHAARVGTALAALHNGRASWARVHRFVDELRTLERWVRLASDSCPEHGEALQDAEAHLQSVALRYPPGRLVPSHRDFYDKQVLIGAGRSIVLDLDTACLAEPELDLANAAAHLQLRAMQGIVADPQPLEQQFLAAYTAATAGYEWDRKQVYRACALLRLACLYALRPAWSQLAPELVTAALGGIRH